MKNSNFITLLIALIIAFGQQVLALDGQEYVKPPKVLTIKHMIEQPGGIFDTHSLSRDEVFEYLSKNPHYETWYNSNASNIYDNGITVVSRPKTQQSCCEFLPLPSTTIIEYKFKDGTLSCTEYDFLYTEKKEALEARKNLIKQLKSFDYSRTEKDSDSETYDGIEAEFLIGNISVDEDNGMTVYLLSIFVYPKDEI